MGTDGNGCWKVTCHRMLVAVQLCRADALGAEICHFTGTSDYHGHVAVTTNVAAAHGVTTVDVAGTFEATTMFWPRIRYLVEEMRFFAVWCGLKRPQEGELRSSFPATR